MYQSKEKATKILYKCPTCKDGGRIIIQKYPDIDIYNNPVKLDYAVNCPDCNGGQAIRAEYARERANIPPSFYDKRMDSFKWGIYRDTKGNPIDMAKLEKVVNSFITNFDKWDAMGTGLYIWSNMRGSGKTFLASCICNELIARYPMSTKFVSASKLIDIVKSGVKDSMDKYEREPIELLCECKLLVIDDLGQNASANNWIHDILFQITDRRSQSKLVTIVTSNIALEKLEMDDRIVDRLYQMCAQIQLPDFGIRQRKVSQERKAFFEEMGIA